MKRQHARRVEFRVSIDDLPAIRCDLEAMPGAPEGAHVARILDPVGDVAEYRAVGRQSVAKLLVRLSQHSIWGVEVEWSGGRETRRTTAGDDGWAWAVGVQGRILADGLGVRS